MDPFSLLETVEISELESEEISFSPDVVGKIVGIRCPISDAEIGNTGTMDAARLDLADPMSLDCRIDANSIASVFDASETGVSGMKFVVDLVAIRSLPGERLSFLEARVMDCLIDLLSEDKIGDRSIVKLRAYEVSCKKIQLDVKLIRYHVITTKDQLITQDQDLDLPRKLASSAVSSRRNLLNV